MGVFICERCRRHRPRTPYQPMWDHLCADCKAFHDLLRGIALRHRRDEDR